MEELEEMEEDAGLGNGGLGRLAGEGDRVKETGFHYILTTLNNSKLLEKWRSKKRKGFKTSHFPTSLLQQYSIIMLGIFWQLPNK